MGDVIKKVEKLRRRRVLLETLQIKPRMILTVVGGHTHRGERYENQLRRGYIRPHKYFEYRGDFDHLGDVD
jgi:hypothetical protein